MTLVPGIHIVEVKSAEECVSVSGYNGWRIRTKVGATGTDIFLYLSAAPGARWMWQDVLMFLENVDGLVDRSFMVVIRNDEWNGNDRIAEFLCEVFQ